MTLPIFAGAFTLAAAALLAMRAAAAIANAGRQSMVKVCIDQRRRENTKPQG